MKNLPKQIKIALLLIVCAVVYSTIKSVAVDVAKVFNDNVYYTSTYSEVCQRQVSDYDGFYNQFMDQNDIAFINKETFIEVTNIVMSNRKDGEQLAWKWVHENQNIPFAEFTAFYHILVGSINQRYEENRKIEREKQRIVKEQNQLISVYPNNIYNRLLGIKPLKYQFGYISTKTLTKFNIR